jgi:hypothetical protein
MSTRMHCHRCGAQYPDIAVEVQKLTGEKTKVKIAWCNICNKPFWATIFNPELHDKKNKYLD